MIGLGKLFSRGMRLFFHHINPKFTKVLRIHPMTELYGNIDGCYERGSSPYIVSFEVYLLDFPSKWVMNSHQFVP